MIEQDPTAERAPGVKSLYTTQLGVDATSKAVELNGGITPLNTDLGVAEGM